MGRSSISVRGLAAIAAACALLCVAAATASAAPLMLASNLEQNTVSVFDTQANEEIGDPIPVGGRPKSIAITPDARFAYVVDEESDGVSVIDLAGRQVVGKPIEVGAIPGEIAISPDGKTAYVAHQFPLGISAIDTRTNRIAGEIALGAYASAIAVSPDGETLYVAEEGAEALEVIDTRTMEVVGAPIELQGRPQAVAVSPDGRTVYVTVEGRGLAAIDMAASKVRYLAGATSPAGLAIAPDGEEAVLTEPVGEARVLAVDLLTGAVTDEVTGVDRPLWVTIAPDGGSAYVTDELSKVVRVFNLRTFKEVGLPITTVGFAASPVAITPDQSPTAAFSPPSNVTAGTPATFSGAASSDPDGSVASWSWAFGDGGTASGVTATHTYKAAGTYGAKLSVVDDEGCGEEMVFTGRTAYCSGNLGASVSHAVTAKAPAVTQPLEPIAGPALPPSNNFHIGRIVHNRRNGTVRLQVKLPSAGYIFLFGKTVHAVTRKSKGPQAMWLTLHARVELAKRLKKTLRAQVRFRITFTPNGGTAKTVHRSVTLQRAPRHRHSRH